MRAGTPEISLNSTRRRPSHGDLLPIEACRAKTVAYTEGGTKPFAEGINALFVQDLTTPSRCRALSLAQRGDGDSPKPRIMERWVLKLHHEHRDEEEPLSPPPRE